ncbi:hypothetical protein PG991_001679 [Apiospora marii]|uniref:F-box domain-containing protein n=1 Tax=Apiospora marii TaxID=335849 RepID=A0ABR1SQD3_9PEZI
MLNNLSAELVVLIFNLLDDSSFLAFRGVSRRLCRASYDLFARRWFALVTTDFTPRSLRRLCHIARNPEIASRVRCLQIARWDRFSNPPKSSLDLPDDDDDDDDDDEPDGIRELWPRCESGCLDLHSRQASGLRDVLLRFARCTAICIIDGADEERWSEPPPDRLQLNPVDMFWFMLSLLKQDGGLQVQRFDVQFETGPVENANGWPSSPELSQLLNRSSWASHLRQLSISWDFRGCLVNIVLPLITTAAHLESLTLHHCSVNGDVKAFLTGLADAPQLPALSRLKLAGGKQVSPTVLPAFIARFQPTLEELWIQNVAVVGGTVGDVLRRLAACDWPALRRITVNACYRVYFCPRLLFRHHQGVERSGGGGFEVTLFSHRWKSRVKGVRYRGHGDDMRLALSALGESAYTVYPQNPEPDTPSMDSYSSAGNQTWRVVRDLV